MEASIFRASPQAKKLWKEWHLAYCTAGLTLILICVAAGGLLVLIQ